ncbi:MAG: ATP-binding protein [Oscillospiraceae bacterium]|nr:ATP-binding protein [Oscillospiraceae bacterium]
MSEIILTTNRLQNGKTVSVGALEITSIPHVSVISSTLSDAEIVRQFKGDFSALLNEVYHLYRASGFSREIALEILWTTEPVSNQPFNAAIRIFFVARSISREKAESESTVSSILEFYRATIIAQKYDCAFVEFEALTEVVQQINDDCIAALVKDERLEDLQNQMLPYCYALDQLPVSENDLSRIVNIMMERPNCAVSFQLIPTRFTAQESRAVDQMAQTLGTLNRGVINQGIGNISFSLAESQANSYRYYADHKSLPLFNYNILIYGNEKSVQAIGGRMIGQLSVGGLERTSLKTLYLAKDEVMKNANFCPLPWAVLEVLIRRDRKQGIWKNRMFTEFYRFPYIVSEEEASEFFRLPIGSERISAGLKINESSRGAKTYAPNIVNAGDIEIGRLRSSAKGDTIGFSLKDLAKHMLVVGTPGSGKTTFSVSLLDRLWKDHGIPFLVIEPAKNEYRALIQSIPELQVFTPGKNSISPFVFNPFVPPKNVKLETYKSTLKTAFSAAVSMSTPLDKIFEETVNNCYSDFRWLDTYTSDDKGRIFNISDFIRCFQQTFDEIGYTGDARNIGRAGIVRLNSLVNLFDNYFSVPIEDILQKPTVIELAAIENSDQKALIIALLLLSVLAYVNANYIGEGGLRNVILLEEAHVLLDAGTNAGQGEADPSAIAQGLVKRMLAEIRSYGVGLVIADQSPRKVSADVVALTDMKVVFRLVESADKQIIGDSTSMTDIQIQRMSKLKPGEAFVFFNKLEEPEEVITPDYRLENNISITLSDDGIRQLSTYWKNREEMLRPYPQCLLCACCSRTCDYSRRVLAREVARRIFNKFIRTGAGDFELVKKVFSHISKLILAELNDEPFTPELLSCVKVHLWRKIRYNTSINISDKLIENSLKK